MPDYSHNGQLSALRIILGQRTYTLLNKEVEQHNRLLVQKILTSVVEVFHEHSKINTPVPILTALPRMKPCYKFLLLKTISGKCVHSKIKVTS
ncbi:hypothetical protein AgCh_001210 [Apium graveolens]